MSSRVRWSAVAVSAMRGTPGKSFRNRLSMRYSGRNSCPQAETQCASSTAIKASSCRHSRSSVPDIISRSGDTYNRSSVPSDNARDTRAPSSGSTSECSAPAETPNWRKAATWSSIRAINGETTTATPCRTSAGTW